MLAVFNSATTCAYNEPFRCGLRLEPGKTAQNFRTTDHFNVKLSYIKHLTLYMGQIHWWLETGQQTKCHGPKSRYRWEDNIIVGLKEIIWERVDITFHTHIYYQIMSSVCNLQHLYIRRLHRI